MTGTPRSVALQEQPLASCSSKRAAFSRSSTSIATYIGTWIDHIAAATIDWIGSGASPSNGSLNVAEPRGIDLDDRARRRNSAARRGRPASSGR